MKTKAKKLSCDCWYGVNLDFNDSSVKLKFVGKGVKAFIEFTHCPKCGKENK